ncbi:MAG: hypothetical protein ACOZF0_08840 [Thermodesulfobacteriota bacterium]
MSVLQANFKVLANQIFHFEPSTEKIGPLAYIKSECFHKHRISLPEFKNSSYPRYAEVTLKDYLRNEKQLGPYERQLLNGILLDPAKLILIAGAIGSGKTSTIKYIIHHYSIFRKRVGVLDFNNLQLEPKNLLDKLSYEVRILNPSYIYLNNNILATDLGALERQGIDRKEMRIKLQENFSDSIYESIVEMFQQTIDYKNTLKNKSRATLLFKFAKTPNELVFDIIDLMLQLVSGSIPLGNCIKTIPFRSILSKVNDEILLNGGLRKENFNSDLARIKNVINSKLSPRDKIKFWFSLIDIIGQLLDNKKNYLFCIVDNIDPLSAYLQHELHDILLNIVERATFKIVVPARFSTFKILNKARGYNWYPHHGPSPIEVITIRLAYFISTPEDFSAYKTIEQKNIKSISLIRAFDILLRMHRGSGAFRSLSRMMEAIAGDSIRKAYDAIRELFLDETLKYSYSEIEYLTDEVNKILSKYLYRSLIEKIGYVIEKEMVEISREAYIPGVESRIIDEKAKENSCRLMMVITSIIDNTFSSVKNITIKISTEAFKKILNIEESGYQAKTRIRAGCYTASKIAKSRGLSTEILKKFTEIMRSTIEIEMKSVLKMQYSNYFGINEIEEFSGFISASLIIEEENIDKIFEDHDFDPDNIAFKWFDEWDESKICRKILSVNSPLNAVRALIKTSAHDIFHNSLDGELCLSKLRILYTLVYDRDHSKTVRFFLDDLEKYFIPEDKILHAINDLINSETRIIWINKQFAYKDIQELYEDGNLNVTLTRRGWGYYSQVLKELTYLQVVFIERKRTSSQHFSFSERVNLCLLGISDLYELEIEKIENRIKFLNKKGYQKERIKSESLPIGLISLDIATRLGINVGKTLFRHFQNVINNPRHSDAASQIEELEGTRKALYKWLIFIETAKGKLSSLYSDQSGLNLDEANYASFLWKARYFDLVEERNVDWNIEYIQRDKVISEIKNILNDQKFWHPDLSKDEFSPEGSAVDPVI